MEERGPGGASEIQDGQKGMARETGLEPAASGVTGRRSNQLSYSRSESVLIRQPRCPVKEKKSARG